MKQKKFTLCQALGSFLVALLLVSCGASSGSSASLNSGADSGTINLSLVADATSIASGASIRLTANVQNSGEATLDSALLGFYRSSDAAISTSDTVLISIFITNIATGSIREFTRSFTGHSAGTLYYGVCLLNINRDSASNICSGGGGDLSRLSHQI